MLDVTKLSLDERYARANSRLRSAEEAYARAQSEFIQARQEAAAVSREWHRVEEAHWKQRREKSKDF